MLNLNQLFKQYFIIFLTVNGKKVRVTCVMSAQNVLVGLNSHYVKIEHFNYLEHNYYLRLALSYTICSLKLSIDFN